jgi:hypothetical protein
MCAEQKKAAALCVVRKIRIYADGEIYKKNLYNFMCMFVATVDMRDGINENNNEHTHTLARMKIFFMK